MHIHNRMLSSGVFPTRLKFAEVKLIYKKGDKNVTFNYRPISLLTSFSKIFEKVIYNRIYHHINYNHILLNEQFGFRHASSTDIASYNLTKNTVFTVFIHSATNVTLDITFTSYITFLTYKHY